MHADDSPSPVAWSASSWREKTLSQGVDYPDAKHLNNVLTRIEAMPPLVTSWETDALTELLAKASRGERFLLQGGDCSEDFADCQPEIIATKLKILLQMSVILVYGARRGVIKVARLAGQYAKPRSSMVETRDGVTLPSYRGSNINHVGFSEAERTPDPDLLVEGYQNAALTLNYLRALTGCGFADLHHPENWDLDFLGDSPQAEEYHGIVGNIRDSVSFLESITENNIDELGQVQVHTSHEALNLPYEQTQTKLGPDGRRWYNLTTHFPWIGDRTRAVNGAHVEYLRGIANPVGVKVGPSITADELLALVDLLNPHNTPGRLTLIHRFGAKQIDTCLPPLIEAVQRHGGIVTWCCDPMHGNTQSTSNGTKTRDFADILAELTRAFAIHAAAGTILGGVHFELTGEAVTECIGGSGKLSEVDLDKTYKSRVDPRLNGEQALEMALLIARQMQHAAGR